MALNYAVIIAQHQLQILARIDLANKTLQLKLTRIVINGFLQLAMSEIVFGMVQVDACLLNNVLNSKDLLILVLNTLLLTDRVKEPIHQHLPVQLMFALKHQPLIILMHSANSGDLVA